MSDTVPFWKQIAVSAALVAAAGFAWSEREALTAWIGGGSETASAPRGARAEGVPVVVAPVTLLADDMSLEVVGTGRATRSVMLRPEASGKVVEMALAPGRRFAAGDQLLRIDDAEARLTLDLARARAEEAARIRDRYAQLQSSGAATSARLDEVATAAEVARLEMERAREALEDHVLLAPFDGVSGLPEPEIGAWIDSGDPVATFDDRSAILVEFELPEAMLSRVRSDMAVTARTRSAPGRDFAGTVSAIDSRVDPRTRTARVRVSIPNDDDALRPGASFTVRLDLPGERHPAAPELAVQFTRGALHVWRIADGVAEKVPVELVRRRAGLVLVDGPLREGDEVAVEGAQRLAPGRKVVVVARDDGSGA